MAVRRASIAARAASACSRVGSRSRSAIAGRAAASAAAITSCSASIWSSSVPGDPGSLEVGPRDLVLALVVVGQLRVEVGPGPAQRGRALGVPVLEGVQRVHEAVEVASEGPVDHSVHAHRRHRPRVGTRGGAEQGFATTPLDRDRARRRSARARGRPGAVRPARRRPRCRRCRRTSPTTGGRRRSARRPCRGTAAADTTRRGVVASRRFALGAMSRPQNTRMAAVAAAAASQPARPPPTTS